MKHLFRKGKNEQRPVLLLLHGTSGTELDLLPLAEVVDSGASVLSVRGNVLEKGMPRFFRRLAEGVFDEQDLIERTKELYTFIGEAADGYGFDRDNVVAIGYSNGANIAGSLLFHYEDALKGAILHHPMVPRRGVSLPSLARKQVFIAAGENDPMCKPEESQELEQLLQDAGASVTLHWGNHGHQLTREEVDAAALWYHRQF
ncbi:alpha/beta hydrolase [Bacillus sp. FJAT-53060]|uniref:alpha/beta hydrolase n=1 Tax=Bacillus TaxID=1386 RepID=UPI001CFACDF3|nr:alpha/beta hydrolase [Bacillus stratosphericus]